MKFYGLGEFLSRKIGPCRPHQGHEKAPSGMTEGGFHVLHRLTKCDSAQPASAEVTERTQKTRAEKQQRPWLRNLGSIADDLSAF